VYKATTACIYGDRLPVHKVIDQRCLWQPVAGDGSSYNRLGWHNHDRLAERYRTWLGQQLAASAVLCGHSQFVFLRHSGLPHEDEQARGLVQYNVGSGSFVASCVEV